MSTTPIHPIKRFRRLVTAVVASAIALGGLVASADPASAATRVAKLTVHTKHCITATGYIPMGPYETHGYLNNGARLSMTMLGDDPGLTDDVLWSTPWITKASGTVNGATLYPSDRGIEFEWVTCGPGHFWLAEDIIGDDEVYVYVMIFDGDGRLMLEGQSNVVSGDYGF
jgi:hypothetical protein